MAIKKLICARCGEKLDFYAAENDELYVFPCDSCIEERAQDITGPIEETLNEACDRDDALTEKLYQLLDTPLKRAQFFYETGEHI